MTQATTSVPAPHPMGNVMEQLKTATTDLHRHAESRNLQRSMAKGALPRDVFVVYLSQMYRVHQALEAQLRTLRDAQPRVQPLFQDDQHREHNLRADLGFYGVDVSTIETGVAAGTLINQIDEAAGTQPLGLLGMLYVLEGSNNGSKYIARAVSRAYGVAPGAPGLSYLDPYGDQQMPRWQAFKRDMDAAGFSPAEINVIVEAAKLMFLGIAEISDELLEPAGT
jgi:heme oxygenase